jgi:predicted aconitase
MELLIALGEMYEASELIPVTSVHISGASYKTIKDAGLKFLREMAEGSNSKVATTVNPIGMDRERYGEMRVKEEFAAKQNEIVELYEKIGIMDSWTCTPYLIGNRPGLGDHISWAESSAVVFANSVLGARTNREGGPSALASSLTGLTPNYGLHSEENRLGDILFELDFDPTERDYASLGYYAGSVCGDRISYFKNISPTEDDLKTMSASLASSGSVSMFHVEDLTPEWRLGLIDGFERVTVGRKELSDIEDKWNTDDDPTLVAIGCPHCSVRELERLAEMLEKGWNGPELWVCTSRGVRDQAPQAVDVINRLGKVLCDTCVIVSSVEDFSDTVATNSGKASTYLPSLCRQKIMFADLETMMRRFQ